ncbi:hypothetical protein FGE12_21005 [Aggregicoccus sp. 17bor-14]|uniref:hypothetical protein n=1 Tax=Myxococcaceae TaxID=31 RepID=UPI00129C967E|nr:MULTISPECIES: hypothetical protein [Myxococcaceae]MBF5044892.1 hypothetical protein [Simulacricoccus sp. 17bor-14]MRI90636.1 hypothetical protein [Aggregicoccus sp. 17bor-14]
MSDKDTLFPDKKAPHEVPAAPRTPAREGDAEAPVIRPQEGPAGTPGESDDGRVIKPQPVRDPYPGVKVF